MTVNRNSSRHSRIEPLESRTLMAAVPAVPTPTGVAVGTLSETQLHLTWTDNSAGVTHFVLERAGGGSRFTQIASLPAGTTSFSDSGLLPLTRYRYRLRGDTDLATSKWSKPGTGVTSTWLAANVVSSSQVNLQWSDYVAGETMFVVDRAGARGSFKRLMTLPADATGYSDTLVSAGTAYRYRVRAVGGAPRLKMATAAAATPAPQSLPTPPIAPSSLLAAAQSASRIDLTWSDISADETGFKVERSANGGSTWTEIATLAPSATSYSAQGLSASTAYQFRVRAFNSAGDSGNSNTASATTLPPTTLPAGFAVTRLVLVNADTDQDVMDLTPGATIDFGFLTTANLNVRAETSAGAESVKFVLNGVDYRTESSAPYTLAGDAGGDYLPWTPAVGQLTLVATPYAQDAAAGSAGTALSVQVTVVDSQPQPQEPAAAPSGLSATAVSSSMISLAWTDNSVNESGFKVERSADGVSFAQVGTVGANVKAYSATGLSPETAYWFRVRAYNAAGDSAYAAAASATTPAAPAGGTLAAPPRAAVDAAIAAPLIRYNRALPGGSYTNGAWSGGGSVTMAVAAFAGDPSADARLLQQARYSLTGGNDPASNGGYPAQHEVLVTSMFAVLKHTPRVWNQFTDAERAKIDLVMKAALVSGAFMTGDANPYVAAGQQERTLDADTNVSRGWNPNYREGMAGSVMVGLAYFGVAGAQAVLSGYDHAAFVAELQAAGLSNIHQTFNWKAANPASIAPSGATIQAAVRAPYRYFGVPLADVMGIYGLQVADTYADVVTAGLNDGAGIDGAGKIVSGAETLPNRGARGMLKEFNSLDAGGPRSSASYAYYGFRPHTANALALIASGLWDSDSPAAKMAAARLEVGNTDLWYKLDRGYIGYAKGGNSGVFSVAQDGATWGFAYTRPLWEAVLRPFLQQNVTP